MIRYVRHSGIDKAAWDAMLNNCPGRLWYARSRVLDLVNPEWDALIDVDAGAIMPLVHRRKWCIRYLYNPFGLQQLGMFAPEPEASLSRDFMRAIPGHFRYADIWLNAGMGNLTGLPGNLEPQRNQLLLADRSIDVLRRAYSSNHLRNLRKGTPPIISSDIAPEEFMDLYERTTGSRFGGSPPGSGPVLRALMTDALLEGTGKFSCIRDEGEPMAAACFITWQGRSIFLKSANDHRGLAIQAMFHITDRWIERHAGSGDLLDFAGSNTASVARFNAGFGAHNSTYFRYRLNRLPWPLHFLKP